MVQVVNKEIPSRETTTTMSSSSSCVSATVSAVKVLDDESVKICCWSWKFVIPPTSTTVILHCVNKHLAVVISTDRWHTTSVSGATRQVSLQWRDVIMLLAPLVHRPSDQTEHSKITTHTHSQVFLFFIPWDVFPFFYCYSPSSHFAARSHFFSQMANFEFVPSDVLIFV